MLQVDIVSKITMIEYYQFLKKLEMLPYIVSNAILYIN